jgi:hypothetical protein
MEFKTPVVIIAYNRPWLLKQVLTVVRQVQPTQLFLVVDGPNLERPEDQHKCQQVREILSTVDWSCQVFRNYSEYNQGCGYRIPSGLDWVFEQVETAIILEDDCLPDLSFFQFCQILLSRYGDDPSVTQICGTNRLLQWKYEQQSYHFARYCSAWGWATWKRAWQNYHQHGQLWQDSSIRAKIKGIIKESRQFSYFCQRYQQAIANSGMTWDYQWSLVQLAQQGRSIIPGVNLVKNLGFNREATHTHHFCLSHLLQSVQTMKFPLIEPQRQSYDDEYDCQHFAWSIGQPEPDSLMQMIDELINQGKIVHTLLVLNQAIAAYPHDQSFSDKRNQVLKTHLKLAQK